MKPAGGRRRLKRHAGLRRIAAGALAHADETPVEGMGPVTVLWVIITPTICLYFIGYRSKEILANVFGERGCRLADDDGYQVYRRFRQRLRCWAHLLRKAADSNKVSTPTARAFGQAPTTCWSDLMARFTGAAKASRWT